MSPESDIHHIFRIHLRESMSCGWKPVKFFFHNASYLFSQRGVC